MCGISGIVAKSATRLISEQKSMIEAQHHRGPDGNGIHNFDNCLLGHNRLSIVDLETGDQPMLNNTKALGIVFNGEIYGYKSIRENVKYNYRTTSDTEVLLALYEQHNVSMLDKLPGMFSFAIWDEKEQSLFAARDRFGEKPFFYAITPTGEMVFASELKAICATGLVDLEISKSAVSRFINCGYTGPLETIYTNIKVLPPAHYLVYKNGELTIKRYWNYPSTTSSLSLGDAADKFEDLFTKAIDKQLIADVEVCAFLSGGLDSTSVVSIASKLKPELKTLAFGYKDRLNELPFAKAAAEQYGTRHYELLQDGSNIEDLFLKMVDVYDEPFSDSSAIATYMICKLASEKCKVVLTGDAGDELLGGYTWWYKPIVNELLQKGTSSAKYAFVSAMAVAEKIKEKATGNVDQRTWRTKYTGIINSRKGVSPVEAVQRRFWNFESDVWSSLGLPTPEKFNAPWSEEGNINDAMKFDIADYMPGDILVKTDRASMANSLELRAPFLDVDLAEFAISMPGNFKVDTKADKILLRESIGKYWPDAIKNRGKQGFGVSRDTWKDSEKMKSYYNDYVLSSGAPLYKLLPYKETQNVIQNNKNIIHNLFILSAWIDKTHRN